MANHNSHEASFLKPGKPTIIVYETTGSQLGTGTSNPVSMLTGD